MKLFKSDIWVVIVVLGLPMLIGFGLGNLYFTLPSNLAWPIVALIITGIATWFIYNIQVDGFISKQAENKKKVQEMWDNYHDRKQLAESRKRHP